MKTAEQALQSLVAGNQRYANGESLLSANHLSEQRQKTAAQQAPFAIILGCADSRAPAETIFDQGIGDLFVVRVAGNIATDTQIGSIEFAAANFGTRLIVVLGHSRCGAIAATLGQIDAPSPEQLSPGLRSLVDHIKPALAENALPENKDERLAAAVRANVRSTVEQLQSNSPILADLINNDNLQVVGAEYSLDSGLVEFF